MREKSDEPKPTAGKVQIFIAEPGARDTPQFRAVVHQLREEVAEALAASDLAHYKARKRHEQRGPHRYIAS